jgi:DNA sulfur modification protein DndB
MLAEKVDYATKIHNSSKLSDMIQRELTKERSKEIADYLKTEERFFNSLVVAVYGGDPEWLEVGRLTLPKHADFDEQDIPETVRHSIGFLRLSGKEKLFAIDGQHRLSGIKEAVPKQKGLGDNEISVLLVAHKNTTQGLQRTRRLFTTLNKTAVEVSKGEIIALDEDDTMAICVRRFVEKSKLFKGDRLASNATNNLPVGDNQSLTTIGNLYDVLSILFEKCRGELSYEDLRFIRPDDDVLDSHYRYAKFYLGLLRKNYSVLSEYFRASDTSKVVMKYRGDFGGNILLRPVGLQLITEVVAAVHAHYSLEDAVEIVAALPQTLEKPPFADILWDTRGKKVIVAGRAFARKVMLYLLGHEKGSADIGETYAQRTGQTGNGLSKLKGMRLKEMPLSQEKLAELDEDGD